jgi:hypothetical protein
VALDAPTIGGEALPSVIACGLERQLRLIALLPSTMDACQTE